ncbi:MAG TPA: hypothetical protein DEE98_04140 [Elusimicrobia bacterium]|nr:MAG: hypothetical protein A2278_07150 [Elusimicrobia bacterium RIFOXYA12_FULL_49_49]OGS05987.1 MAG: hypothetical protein A2204_02905 [Elusimicrobia bacterium RIFOXYA1_FULL_47_7]OGS16186.1 MAG: hypothetical protein A2251_01035 [Elusimicrobia bacterium RIFOXYA2_FULL_47_53]OGS26615.1 MAG: hypothetical protein A2339_04325 [Elusimicrobia bacterium RIFOXYB12_FULL_50_12]OGS31340.1 MAG: hypothetical protein A2323_09325 [Elusimicrobia bacterium RIFOXYB2_FULL_46_23]HBU69557.1 hypothetical protein [El
MRTNTVAKEPGAGAVWTARFLVTLFSVSLIVYLWTKWFSVSVPLRSKPAAVNAAGLKASLISWNAAGSYVGKYVTVRGKIAASHNTGKVCMLNFHPDYRKHLTLVIFSGSFHNFPEYPQKYYLGREVTASGLVKEYNGKPEIIINSPEQINVLN